MYLLAFPHMLETLWAVSGALFAGNAVDMIFTAVILYLTMLSFR